GMPGMVHVVEVHKEKVWFFVLYIGNCFFGRIVVSFPVVIIVQGTALYQSGKTGPSIDRPDLKLGPLGTGHSENSGEYRFRSRGHRRKVHIVPIPFVRGDPVLFRSGPGYHGCPISATTGRKYSPSI